MMKKKDLFKNVITGFGGQFIVIVLGIIIPRIMISSYGSDVNGLVTTTAQIFSYLALLEAGIGQSARVALYKPISDNDETGISIVYKSAEVYFRKITTYYGIGVLLLSAVLPFALKSDCSKITILGVFLLEGMSGVISFYYVQTPTILLNTDGKGYVNNLINVINKILSYSVKIFLAYLGANIIFIQFSFFVITVLKVIFYRLYVRKHYSWINKKENIDLDLLKDKNSYLITEIAWTVFSSTDLIILSLFVSTKMSSVYSIYNMIYSNVTLLLNTVAGSVLYILGQIYHRDIEEYKEVHDSFNSFYIGVITILMTVCYLLTIPFIKIYTRDVNDVNYIYTQLPLMFSLVQLLSWSRYVTGNLTGIAGYAKKTSYISLVEAVINVVMSIVLVNFFGIVGVLIATTVALPMKVIWCIYISDVKVLNRSVKKTMMIILVNYLFFFTIVIGSKFIEFNITSYWTFFIYGIVITLIVSPVVVILNLLVNKSCLNIVRKYILKR